MPLDPKTNRQQREAESARDRSEDQPLDPPFPHQWEPFDPLFFELDQAPLPPASGPLFDTQPAA